MNYYIDKYNFSVGMTSHGWAMFCRQASDVLTDSPEIIAVIESIAADNRVCFNGVSQ